MTIDSRKLLDIINFNNVIFLHRIDGQLELIWKRKHCDIVPVELAVLIFLEFLFQALFQQLTIVVVPTRNTV